MDLFNILELIGGLSLFLFGMNLMGQALERRAGNSLRTLLRKLTSSRIIGFLTGVGVTAIIQSSSATTVMVVGFVNSGLMSLGQAINVIIGANVGTTVTSWILSLGAIESNNIIVKLLKPTSFTPILALIGVVQYLFLKDDRKKDTGLILLGFSTLIFGMDTMSGAVAGLKDVPQFQQLFILFRNPILGVLVGALLTAIIQSSSASVGILQALSATGQITIGAAVPIIMGQNIGTCVTALLSSVGTNKNARRTSVVHLLFNVVGSVACLFIYIVIERIFRPAFLNASANQFSIAVCHTAFNVVCTAFLLPQTGLLEKLAIRIVPDDKKLDDVAELDDRLFATPSLALERCRMAGVDMAYIAAKTLYDGIGCLRSYSPELARSVRENEGKTDHYEDALSSYLVKLSSHSASIADSVEAASLLKLIGDFERIADHAVNLVEAAEELLEKDISFGQRANQELSVIYAAVEEVMANARDAFVNNDLAAAVNVEPLEEVVDDLKEILRSRHIHRLQNGGSTIEAGFIWSDLLTGLERISDHCSNIAVCIIDMSHNNMNQHEATQTMRMNNQTFDEMYQSYKEKYKLP